MASQPGEEFLTPTEKARKRAAYVMSQAKPVKVLDLEHSIHTH